MTDPTTLAEVGIYTLTQGVKFLYSQAGEILKWRRKLAETQPAKPEGSLDASTAASPAINQQLDLSKIDNAQVTLLADDLRDLRASLANVVDEIDPIEISDKDQLARIDALRKVLEVLAGTPITFRGEPILPSQASYRSEVEVAKVSGYVAGLRAKRLIGDTTVYIKADEVAEGGSVLGIDADSVGN